MEKERAEMKKYIKTNVNYIFFYILKKKKIDCEFTTYIL